MSLVLFGVSGMVLTGCTSSEEAAKESYELAQFEERQGNLEHASQLYQEILNRYPSTSWAEKAQGRLDSIVSPTGP